MIPTLYHYNHCPYCIRVRMAAGFLKISYEAKTLPYDDEETPQRLIGKKMCPIWVDDAGKAMGESLDIIRKIDIQNILKISSLTKTDAWFKLEKELAEIGSLVHSLAMPHWIYTKEFNEKSREYFQKKKEEKRGPFESLIKNRDKFEKELLNKLSNFSENLQPYYHSSEMGIFDILIAAQLWGLYIVPEFYLPLKIHNYLQSVKSKCNFKYSD